VREMKGAGACHGYSLDTEAGAWSARFDRGYVYLSDASFMAILILLAWRLGVA
jgi:hypothetical protein